MMMGYPGMHYGMQQHQQHQQHQQQQQQYGMYMGGYPGPVGAPAPYPQPPLPFGFSFGVSPAAVPYKGPPRHSFGQGKHVL